jgi:uncharacterized protein with PIN domain
MVTGLWRWLRFMGFKTLVISDISKLKDVMQKSPDIIFITGSKKHYELTFKNRSILLENLKIKNQLNELDQKFQIFDKIEFLSICSVCNEKIKKIKKESVKEHVPEKIWELYQQFWICGKCNRIYWQGGHIKRLKQKFNSIGIPIPESKGQ